MRLNSPGGLRRPHRKFRHTVRVRRSVILVFVCLFIQNSLLSLFCAKMSKHGALATMKKETCAAIDQSPCVYPINQVLVIGGESIIFFANKPPLLLLLATAEAAVLRFGSSSYVRRNVNEVVRFAGQIWEWCVSGCGCGCGCYFPTNAIDAALLFVFPAPTRATLLLLLLLPCCYK